MMTNARKLLSEAQDHEARGDHAGARELYEKVVAYGDEQLARPHLERDQDAMRSAKVAEQRIDRLDKRKRRDDNTEQLAVRAASYVERHTEHELDAEVDRAIEAEIGATGQRPALQWAVALRRADLALAPDDPARQAKLGIALRRDNKFPEASAWLDRAAATLEGRTPPAVDPRAVHEPVKPVATGAPDELVERAAWIYTAQAALWGDLGVNDPERQHQTTESRWWSAAEAQYARLERVLGRNDRYLVPAVAGLVLNYVDAACRSADVKRARALIASVRDSSASWRLRRRFNALSRAHGFEPFS